jgi:hypothetical protein
MSTTWATAAVLGCCTRHAPARCVQRWSPGPFHQAILNMRARVPQPEPALVDIAEPAQITAPSPVSCTAQLQPQARTTHRLWMASRAAAHRFRSAGSEQAAGTQQAALCVAMGSRCHQLARQCLWQRRALTRSDSRAPPLRDLRSPLQGQSCWLQHRQLGERESIPGPAGRADRLLGKHHTCSTAPPQSRGPCTRSVESERSCACGRAVSLQAASVCQMPHRLAARVCTLTQPGVHRAYGAAASPQLLGLHPRERHRSLSMHWHCCARLQQLEHAGLINM